MIKKYIKKPVEVEAIQLTESNIEDVLDFICDGHNFDMCSDITKKETISLIKANNFYITVNETDVKVNFGDYIVKGHNNLFYKIPAKEFEATYQSVGDFIDLNKLKNYKCLAYPNAAAQLMKVLEEVEEVKQAITLENGHMWLKEENRDNVISEVFDVIRASINLLYVIGINKEDFEKHIEKLNVYKETKYKK